MIWALPTSLILLLLLCCCHDACMRLDHDWDKLGLETRTYTGGPGPVTGTAHISKCRCHRCSLKVISAGKRLISPDLFSLELKVTQLKSSFTHLLNTDANAKMAAR